MSVVSALNGLGSWKLFAVFLAMYLYNNYRIYQYQYNVLDPLMGGEKVPDLRFGFSLADIRQFFSRGVELQAAYERVYTEGYDIFMPLFMNLWAISLLSIFYPGTKLVLIPVFCFLFDMLENYTIYRMIQKYRSDHLEENDENNNLAMMGNFDNLLKWFFAVFGGLLLIYGLLRHIYRAVAGNTSKKVKKINNSKIKKVK